MSGTRKARSGLTRTMSQQQYTSTLWEQRPQAEWEVDSSCDENFPRNITFIDNLKLDPKLQPTTYHLAGSHTSSKILFTDVSVLDSTGQKPYGGDLLIKGLAQLLHHSEVKSY